MKKSIIRISCMMICVLGLTACESKAEKVAESEFTIEQMEHIDTLADLLEQNGFGLNCKSTGEERYKELSYLLTFSIEETKENIAKKREKIESGVQIFDPGQKAEWPDSLVVIGSGGPEQK